MKFMNGVTYDGEWFMDEWSGTGTLIEVAGDRYTGDFFKGKKHKRGI